MPIFTIQGFPIEQLHGLVYVVNQESPNVATPSHKVFIVFHV